MVIAYRNLPSIVVTLGMSFVWAGLGGAGAADARRHRAGLGRGGHGRAPLADADGDRRASIIIAVFAHVLIMRSSFGVLIRGVGGNERSVARAGWSVLRARGAAYATAACFCGGLGDHAGRSDDLGGCQYRLALHALVDCRRDPWRWRVHRRAGVGRRRGVRGADAACWRGRS